MSKRCGCSPTVLPVSVLLQLAILDFQRRCDPLRNLSTEVAAPSNVLEGNFAICRLPCGWEPFPYQAFGIRWLVANYMQRRSCILADEVGSITDWQGLYFWSFVLLHAAQQCFCALVITTTIHGMMDVIAARHYIL